MTEWVMPAALASPAPRKVSMNGCWGGMLILGAIGAGFFIMLILAVAGASSLTMSALQQRGSK